MGVKVVTKHFSGATTNDMKFYIQPMISINPEYILLYRLTSNLRQDNGAVKIEKKVMKSDNNNILVTEIVPQCDKLDAKATDGNIHLKNEFNKRNIRFIDNTNINPRYNCKKSGIYLSKSGTNKVIEKILFSLSKFGY